MHNSQVTVPIYRETSLYFRISMLCPGISQNTKQHQLTLYNGQVWRSKAYQELCDNRLLGIAYNPYPYLHKYDIMEQNGELYVPPVPGYRFIRGGTMISWDSEILQSFAELNNITQITFVYRKTDYHIWVGSYSGTSTTV